MQLLSHLLQSSSDGQWHTFSEVHKAFGSSPKNHFLLPLSAIPSDKKGDKTDCNNYRRISLLSTSYKIFSNMLLSRLGPYIDEIIGDN
jgi:hypothetical protein